jgi:hypothetical protein
MDHNTLNKIIRNLGYTHDSLLQNGIIPASTPSKLYDEGDTLEVELEQGFELVFSESLRFETIFIVLDINNSSRFNHQENLPTPLSLLKSKFEVTNILGKPIHSASKIDLLNSDLFGWDTYQLPEHLHPSSFLDVQYDAQMNVKYLLITLMDPD